MESATAGGAATGNYRQGGLFNLSVVNRYQPTGVPHGYGVTPMMHALASAADRADAAAVSSRTAIFTTFLTGATYEATHGSFGKARASDVHKLVDALVARSPGLCAPGTTLTVIHDLPSHQRVRRGVRYLRVPPAAADGPRDAHNRRWVLIHEALRARRGRARADADDDRAHVGAPADGAEARAIRGRAAPRAEALAEEAECAYAIDLTDVTVVRVPPCAALAEQLPGRLLIATDGQSRGTRSWLHKARAVYV